MIILIVQYSFQLYLPCLSFSLGFQKWEFFMRHPVLWGLEHLWTHKVGVKANKKVL